MRGRADQDAHIKSSRLRCPGVNSKPTGALRATISCYGSSGACGTRKDTWRRWDTAKADSSAMRTSLLGDAPETKKCTKIQDAPEGATGSSKVTGVGRAPRPARFAACTNHNHSAVGLAQEALVQFRAARVAQAQNPGALGPECTHPCFSTKQSYPCFGHLAPVVVSRSRT